MKGEYMLWANYAQQGLMYALPSFDQLNVSIKTNDVSTIPSHGIPELWTSTVEAE